MPCQSNVPSNFRGAIKICIYSVLTLQFALEENKASHVHLLFLPYSGHLMDEDLVPFKKFVLIYFYTSH